MIRSLIWRVGTIEPDGMKKVWTTKARSRKVAPMTSTTSTAHSMSQPAHRAADGGRSAGPGGRGTVRAGAAAVGRVRAWTPSGAASGTEVSVGSGVTTHGPYCTAGPAHRRTRSVPTGQLWPHSPAMSFSTRSSWDRKGSFSSTVRWAWSLSFRWTQSTVKSRRRSLARRTNSPRSRARVVCGGVDMAAAMAASSQIRSSWSWCWSR